MEVNNGPTISHVNRLTGLPHQQVALFFFFFAGFMEMGRKKQVVSHVNKKEEEYSDQKNPNSGGMFHSFVPAMSPTT